jgi:hypothetical protein
MKRIGLVALMSVISILAYAQQLKGKITVTPTATNVCMALNKGTYLAQANLTVQDYTSAPYMFSSVKLFTSKTFVAALTGPAPTDGGYVQDGGVNFWQLLPPIVLKDTDTATFSVNVPDMALCYSAGTTADGGVSAMTLSLHDVIK